MWTARVPFVQLYGSWLEAFGAADTDIDIVSVYPHMHLLGTSIKVEAQLADGMKAA